MRLCLSLQAKKKNFVLPIHYNRLIQGAVYENISTELADFLHDKGYLHNGRSFKFFTFSRLLGRYHLNRDRKQISFPEGAKLYISSPIKEFCTSLMGCMLGDGEICLGNLSLEVTGITAEKAEVSGESVGLNLISPVVVYSTFEKPGGGKYTCYFQPGENEFTRLLEANLRRKYEAFYGSEAPGGRLTVEQLNRPRMNITKYKDTVIKGYTCRMRLNGPRELLQVAVDAGLGAKNPQGFGCVELEKGTREGGDLNC